MKVYVSTSPAVWDFVLKRRRGGYIHLHIKDGETEIQKIVAVSDDSVLSPCGRCREMMVQVNRANLDCEVVLDYAHTVKLKELIPYHWMENMQA
jgi:cytidine deaminase